MVSLLASPRGGEADHRVRRWWFAGAAVVTLVLVGVSVAVVMSLTGSNGPLSASRPFRYTLQGAPGRTFTWSTVYLQNAGDAPLVIDAVSLPVGKLKLDALRLTNPKGWNATGGLYGSWPPRNMAPGDLLPPGGVTLPRHGLTRVFAEVTIPVRGRYPIGETIEVRYHIGSATYDHTFNTGPKPDLLYTRP